MNKNPISNTNPPQDNSLAPLVDGLLNVGLPDINEEAGQDDASMESRLKNSHIKETKELRVAIDGVIQNLKGASLRPEGNSRERSLCLTKLQEAVMWLGMDLKERGAQNPYPNSYNPGNAIVDPTADGLKL